MKKRLILVLCCSMILSSAQYSNNFVYATNDVTRDTAIEGEETDQNETEQPAVKDGIEKDGIEKDEIVQDNKEKDTNTGATDNTDKQEVISQSADLNTVPIWQGGIDVSWFTNDKTSYEISTPDQLAGLASLVNSGNPMTNITFALTNDIYLNEDATPEANLWPMIGNNTANSFAGSIDGQNHTVYNVYVNETTYNYAGFLGQTLHSEPLKNIVITGSVTGKLQAGVIGRINDNVTLENITNKANITAVQPAGIVSECDTLRIADCVNEGTITALVVAGTEGSRKAGGILAYSYRNTTMKNCHNKGVVKGNEKTGGLIGYGSTMTIDGSSNTANISGNGYQVGGLVGETLGSNISVLISNSSSSGNIYGWGDAGGLVGKNSGSIHNSNNLGGKVETYYHNAGGIVGIQTQSNTNADYYGQIINCTNKANVTAAIGGGEEQYSRYAGGIIGAADKAGKIDKCINFGTIKGKNYVGGLVGVVYSGSSDVISNSENKGTLDGAAFVGGCVGYIYGKISIESSSNSANITGNGYDVGGLVGYNENGTISDSTTSGNIYGWGSTGGIVGTNHATIDNCQNTGGKVETYFSNAGGIVGWQMSTKTEALDYGEIINCSNNAAVNAGIGNAVDNAAGAGGIIGGVERMKGVSGCTNTGEVRGIDTIGGIIGVTMDTAAGKITSCVNEGIVEGVRWTGGIVGSNKGLITITKCTNKGNLTMMRNAAVAGQNIGGITSYTPADTKIDQCVNEGDIVSIGDWSGGIVGSSTAAVTNCKNNGNMKIETIDKNNSTKYMKIGMIAGWSKGDITSCINNGQLDVLLAAEYPITNDSSVDYYVGGIVGWIGEATVSKCYNNADITGTRNTMIQLATQYYNFGGIVGYGSKAVTQYSHNAGKIDVHDTSNDKKSNQVYIGGIASRSYGDSEIMESSNTGDLHTNVSSGYLGGIAGKIDETDILNSFATCDLYADTTEVVFISGVTLFFEPFGVGGHVMDNVYYAGDMIIQNPANEYALGAICGAVPYLGSLRNVFYDADVLSKNVLLYDNVRKLHTYEMTGTNMDKNTTALDFENTWVMKEDYQSNGNKKRFYPTLRSNMEETNNTFQYYLVSAKKDPRFDIKIDPQFDKDGMVLPRHNYEFSVDIKDAYQSLNYKVLDNNVEIQPVQDNLYRLSDIQQDHQITVQFDLLQPTVVFPQEIVIHYGESLKDAKFEFTGDGQMSFKEDKKLTVKESGQKHMMVFEPKDQYLYQTVEQEVIVHVLPADASKPKDIKLPFKKDLPLKDVTLPSGWSWDDGELSVQVGSHKYKASFHDEEGNYNDMNHIEITIYMEKEAVNTEKPLKPEAPGDQDSNGKVETGDTGTMTFYLLFAVLSLGICVRIRKYKRKY